MTKRQRITYTITSFFLSLILIVLLDGLKIVTNSWVSFGLLVLITILVYSNPTLGRQLAKVWASWTVLGSRGITNPQGVKLATDIAQNKVNVDDKIEQQAAKVVILVIIGIVVAFIILASLLT